MKLRKIFAVTMALLLVLSLSFVLFACGEKECTHEDLNTDGKCDKCSAIIGECTHADADQDGKCDKCNQTVSAPQANGNVTLAAEGKPLFSVVLSGAALGATDDAEDFIKDLNRALTDGEVELVVDEGTAEPNSVEILIGPFDNRGDDYNVDIHYLGYKGFAIRVVGTRVQVLAGSDSAYKSALKYLLEEVMGVVDRKSKITNLTVTNANNYQELTKHTVTNATIANNRLHDYVFAIDTTEKFKGEIAAEKLPLALVTTYQEAIYRLTGAWLEIIDLKDLKATDKAIVFDLLTDGEDCGCEEGMRIYVDGDDLRFNCEFPDKFYENAKQFLDKNFINISGNTIRIEASLDNRIDVRNIYYKDFGAIGNGENDDFMEIRAAHEYANLWGHTVNADLENSLGEVPTYYIGKDTLGKDEKGRSVALSIPVMTDTYWHGCTFIFDDSQIVTHEHSHNCDECYIRRGNIFHVKSDYGDGVEITSLFNGVKLNGGYGEPDNTLRIENWPLNYDAWVTIYDDSIRRFVRQGDNADAGDSQCEGLLIREDGTIHTSTPLSYDYNEVSWAGAYNVEDTPITIDGGGAKIITKSNLPDNADYNAYSRNIHVTRSNTTICNFDHTITEQGEFRAPYAGILNVRCCNNVKFENIQLQNHKPMEGQGTYEIGGYMANDITYIDVNTINFTNNYAPGKTDGTITYRGAMGTNYCRNFHFKDCILTSFDSHKGLGNVRLEGCTFEHINIQGSGKAEIIDSTVYVAAGRAVFLFRSDYGGSWNGDVVIDKVEMLYSEDDISANSNIHVIQSQNDPDPMKTYWASEKIGGKYEHIPTTLYLPKTITINKLTLWKYEYDGVTDLRLPNITSKVPDTMREVFLFNEYVFNGTSDFSEFSDGFINRYAPTEELRITDSTLNLKIPDITKHSPTFRDTKVYIDGEEQKHKFS